MYCILMDKRTKAHYMLPDRMCFYTFTSPDKYTQRNQNARLVETEYDNYGDLITDLYNAGFSQGFLDDKIIYINKKDAYYLNRNSNEAAYAQYILTKKPTYLSLIKKKDLVTICKIDGDAIYFPTVKINEEVAVLTYTDRLRIPQKLFDNYPGYRVVKMSYNVKCVVNGQVVAE